MPAVEELAAAIGDAIADVVQVPSGLNLADLAKNAAGDVFSALETASRSL